MQSLSQQAAPSLDQTRERAKKIRSDALRIIQRWPSLTRSQRKYLDYIIRIIPDDDLLRGQGLIYMRAGTLSTLAEIPPATMNLVERQLSGVTPHVTRNGTTPVLIERLTGINGERYQYEGYGISVAPLLRQIPHLLHEIRQRELAGRNHESLRRQVKSLRAEISRLNDTLPHRIQTRFLNYMADTWMLRPGRASVPALQKHLDALARLLCAVNRAIYRAVSGKSISDPSLTDEQRYTHISISNSCNAGEKGEAEKSGHTGNEAEEQALTALTEARDRAQPCKRRPRDKITGNDLSSLASPDMQYLMQAAESGGHADLGQIARIRAAEIGVPRPVTERLIAKCGPSNAFLAVLLTDQNRHNVKKPVRNPSALLNWMISAYEAGKLNLSRGLSDLSWRLKQGHIASSPQKSGYGY